MPESKGRKSGNGIGAALGVAFGAAYGISSANPSQSIAMGLALGVAVGAIFDFVKHINNQSNKENKPPVRSLQPQIHRYQVCNLPYKSHCVKNKLSNP